MGEQLALMLYGEPDSEPQALAKEGEKWQEEERTSSGQKTEEDADIIPFEDNDEEKL